MPSNKIRHNWGDGTAETESVYSLTNTGIEDTVHGWDDSKYDDWMYRFDIDTRPRHIWLTDWLYNEIKIETDPHRVRLLNTDMSLVDVLDRRIFTYAKDLIEHRVDGQGYNSNDYDNLIRMESYRDRIYLRTARDSYVDLDGEDIYIDADRYLYLNGYGGMSFGNYMTASDNRMYMRTRDLIDIRVDRENEIDYSYSDRVDGLHNKNDGDMVNSEMDNPVLPPTFRITIDSVKSEMKVVDKRGNEILLESDSDKIQLKTAGESYVNLTGEDIDIKASRDVKISAGRDMKIYPSEKLDIGAGNQVKICPDTGSSGLQLCEHVYADLLDRLVSAENRISYLESRLSS